MKHRYRSAPSGTLFYCVHVLIYLVQDINSKPEFRVSQEHSSPFYTVIPPNRGQSFLPGIFDVQNEHTWELNSRCGTTRSFDVIEGASGKGDL